MSRIVVGYDASPGSRASLERAVQLAGPLEDGITVVFGYLPPVLFGGEISRTRRRSRARAKRCWRRRATRLRGWGRRSRPGSCASTRSTRCSRRRRARERE